MEFSPEFLLNSRIENTTRIKNAHVKQKDEEQRVLCRRHAIILHTFGIMNIFPRQSLGYTDVYRTNLYDVRDFLALQ